MILLDTSALIELADGTERGKIVKQYLEKSIEVLGTTVFTVHELLLPVSGEEEEKLKDLLSRFLILTFDHEAALESVRLNTLMKKEGAVLSKIDLFIASICKAKKASLFTFDADFSRVPELKIISK